MSESRLGYQAGLIGFIRPTTLLRLTHRIPTVSPRRAARLGGVIASSLASAPLAGWEALREGRRIRATQIQESPTFIVGHWRSGTTHLHNVMSQDPRFGSLRMFQTLAPDCSLSTQPWLPSLMSRVMPKKRPMDNMEWPMDAPQEEEIALAKTTPYSWYLSFLFPKQAIESFDRFVLLEGAPPRVREEVKAKLHQLYQVATIHEQGRRLLSKNPVHTCRIPLLLEMFPDARFIFIHRNPYEIFSSTINLHRRILDLTSMQEVDDEAIEENVVRLHRRVTSAYLRDRELVPEGQLCEIGYEDLVRRPLTVLHQTYEALGLQDFETARPRMAKYLEAQSSYRKNDFNLTDRARERIEEDWRDDFEEWGYAPGPLAA